MILERQDTKALVFSGLACVLLLLITELTSLDSVVSGTIYRLSGERWIDNWFIETILHKYTQTLGRLAIAILLLMAILASSITRLKEYRNVLWFIVVAGLASSFVVVILKNVTQIDCPYHLVDFGGEKTSYSPFDLSRWSFNGGGRCWPGGHSSTVFAWWSLYFLAQDKSSKLATPIFLMIFLLGNILGFFRVLQGAHFISHQWWTALICWWVTIVIHWLFYREKTKVN